MDWFSATMGFIGAALGAFVTWVANRGQLAVNNRLLTEQMEQAKKGWEQERTKVVGERENFRQSFEQSKEQCSGLLAKVKDLEATEAKFLAVRSRLSKSLEIREFRQPVLLVGPREVGKSSLLAQWHAPWDHSPLNRSQTVRTCEVPVFNFTEPEREPHFADPEIFVTIETQLLLRVHDFPGEPDYQKAICETVRSEMNALRSESRKDLGLVLVCMFDAEEAKKGISRETREYYNGDLFQELCTLVTFKEVDLQRLIFVFNKYDHLQQHFPAGTDDPNLLDTCIEEFDHVFKTMRTFCDRRKVCEVITILSREKLLFKNQGATIVKGEAARGIVQAFAKDNARAQPLLEQRATNRVREKFL